MEANAIKAAIERAGTSQSAIAAYLGVTPGTVNRVVRKVSRSQRIEAELEKITGEPIFDEPIRKGRRKSVWTGKVLA